MSSTCNHAKSNILAITEDNSTLHQTIKHSAERGALFQQSLLPFDISYIKGLNFASAHVPLLRLGGDFFTIKKIDNNKVFLVIADASGSGIIGALLCTMFVGCLASCDDLWHEPAQLLHVLNRNLCKNLSGGLHITALAGAFCLRTKSLIFANAGHPVPLLFQRGIGKVETLEQKGLFLGMFSDVSYEEQCVSLESGDRLFFYTDGLTQGGSTCKEPPLDITILGSELLRCKDRHIKEIPQEMCQRALALTRCNCFEDDVVVLAVEAE